MTDQADIADLAPSPGAAIAPETPFVEAAPPPAEGFSPAARPREIGGRGGPDPTRYGDWELKGRCIDF
jgi:hypothetical protein